MRLLYLFFVLAIVFLIPFLLWGENIEAFLSQDALVNELQSNSRWAWLAALILLLLDLFLPIPATVVITALGIVYGPLIGGLIGTIGTFSAGALGYGLCQMLGQQAAVLFVGKNELQKGEQLFANKGGWLIVLSRWLPIFPEVIACMAGLMRMPLRLFTAAMLCGCIPFAFTFAGVGHAGMDYPLFTMSMSLLAPLVLWLLVKPFFSGQANS